MEQNPHVETIQVVMDEQLRRRVDQAARRLKVNRSALIREALRQHLKRLQVRDREDADHRGYERVPERPQELHRWDRAASWPEE